MTANSRQAGAGDLRRRRDLRAWRDGDRDRSQPPVLPDGARHHREDGARAAGQGFVDEIIEELDNEELVEALETRIEQWLEAIMAEIMESRPRL
jgi:PleD family two-component response regulator